MEGLVGWGLGVSFEGGGGTCQDGDRGNLEWVLRGWGVLGGYTSRLPGGGRGS